jgi:hypothetical protein
MCVRNLRIIFFFLLSFSVFQSQSQQLLETQIDVSAGTRVEKKEAVIYLPPKFQKSKPYPLVIFTHGIGESGKNVKKLYKQGLPKVLKEGYRPSFDFIMVAVQHPTFSVPAGWLSGILEDCHKRWKIDAARIYLTGISAGGRAAYGSQLDISPAFAKKFAAIVINSGVTDGNKKNLDWWKQTKTPLWAIVGAADKSYVSRNKYMVNEINKRVAGLAILTLRPGVGHGGWTDVYKGKVELNGKNIWEWMYQFKRSGNDADEGEEPVEDAGARHININIYGGKNAFQNNSWYNWNVGASEESNIKTKALNYSNGTTSTVRAVLSSSDGMLDNSAGYGSGMAPAEVLRYASGAAKNRTLTITGLSPSKKYTIALFGSRKRNPGNVTLFKINKTVHKVATYNNLEDEAIFKDATPDKKGDIIIKIESANTYNYLNGFTITETAATDD